MTLTNLTINPETLVRVLLPASEIPDGAAVTKRTGDKLYTLRHAVALWTADHKQEVLCEGNFIFDTQGNINSLPPHMLLHWHLTAEDFIDTLKRSWDIEE